MTMLRHRKQASGVMPNFKLMESTKCATSSFDRNSAQCKIMSFTPALHHMLFFVFPRLVWLEICEKRFELFVEKSSKSTMILGIFRNRASSWKKYEQV